MITFFQFSTIILLTTLRLEGRTAFFLLPINSLKHIVTGIIANVDAGKTTLSEALLYQTGNLLNLGRVDNGNTFLDTDQLEKKRGITIFSHQANLEYNDLSLTILDTPGHVDFVT